MEPGSGATPTIHQLSPVAAAARDLTALLPLATRELLLGTRHRGILVYKGATLASLHFTLPGVNPATLQITALAAVDSASFLIGTRDSGVFYRHAGTVDHINSTSGLPDDQVESIAVSSTRAFVGTAEFDLTGSLFQPVRVLAEGVFSHALILDNHQLIIGTLDQGIQPVPLETARLFAASRSPPARLPCRRSGSTPFSQVRMRPHLKNQWFRENQKDRLTPIYSR